MKYEFFDHTADAIFKAYGKTIEEKFKNSAYAMWSIIVEPGTVKGKLQKNVEIESNDIKSLLYEFLEHFLIVLDSENFLLNKITKIKITHDEKGKKYNLIAEYDGDHAEGYATIEHVKAVTYNSMELKEEYIQVVLDL